MHPLGLGGLVITAIVGLSGCLGLPPHHESQPLTSLAPALTIPANVQRIAVFYSRSSNPDFVEAYQRLEGLTFQLKGKRPSLRIVDRFNLPAIMTEQRFQMAGAVTDESAVRAGQLLGVDSVLLYTIDGPTLRDRFFARRPGDVRPITVTTKIIRVESAEVVYHNVVTAAMEDERGGWSLADNMDYHQLSRAALERGIVRTIDDLQRAFE